LVIDEARMLGTRDTAALVRATGRAGAKLVLVGDDAQLPEIAAGGAFRGLARGSIRSAWRATGDSATPGSARPWSTCAKDVRSGRWPPTCWPVA
jgi:hypothetical protein